MSEVKTLKRKLLLKTVILGYKCLLPVAPGSEIYPLLYPLLLFSFTVNDKLISVASKEIIVPASLISVKWVLLLLCSWYYEGLVANLC